MKPKVINEDDLIDALEKYIEAESIPIIAEFAYKYPINRTYLYKLAENNNTLRDTIKNLIDKKESALEKKGLNNEINSTMAIFSLKQLDWTDTKNINLKSNDFDITKLTKEELQEQIAKLEQK